MNKSFWLIIFTLAGAKIWLMLAIPVTAVGYNIHDDTLFIRQSGGFGLWLTNIFGQSTSLTSFNMHFPGSGWLGQYNELILSKGPVYGIWITFCFLTGIPLLTAQQMLIIGAAILTIVGLRKLVSSQTLLLLLFALLVFNPEYVSRIVRAGIYPALSLLIIASLFGLYSCRNEHWKQLGAWSIFLGCILPFFWMTREEGIWLIPSILFILGVTLFTVYYRQGFCRQLIIKASLVCLPFLLLFGATQMVSLLNNHYYGTRCVVELKSESFRSCYGALLRVKHKTRPFIAVPFSVREKLYDVSPAFKELEPFLEGEQGKMWRQFGCQVYPETCGDIASGWFLEAFRDAVALAGHHANGREADRYYSQLAQEINMACTENRISCLPERKSLMPPLTSQDYVKMIQNIPKGLFFLLRYENLLQRLHLPFHSIGDSERLSYYQDMTRETIAPTKDGATQMSSLLPKQTLLNNKKIKILSSIAGFYRTITTTLFALALLSYCLSLVNSLRERQLSSLALFNTTLIIGVSCRLVILSLIDITSFPGFNQYYLSPLYGFVLLFISLSFIDLIRIASQKRRIELNKVTDKSLSDTNDQSATIQSTSTKRVCTGTTFSKSKY